MINWFVSSCILILVVIALRTVLNGKIAPFVQYALWALVLIRLLIPLHFGETAFSVSNLTESIKQTPTLQDIAQMQISSKSYDTAHAEVLQQFASAGVKPEYIMEDELQQHIHALMQGESLSRIVSRVAFLVWICGALAVAALFLYSNLRFRKQLLLSRRSIPAPSGKLPVYIAENTDTPCLFGILHPEIYVTPAVAQDSTLLQYAITHELMHHRHGDLVWSVLRCACLTVHWYNPLVWWAARLSLRDAELCCDASAIKQLGEKERAQYGRALISMTCQKHAGILLTSTTMTAKKNDIRERIVAIAKKPRTALHTLVAALLIAVVAAGCTFTGANPAPNAPKDNITATEEKTTAATFVPVPPAEIADLKNFLSAKLCWTDGTYTLTDPIILKELENILQRSSPLDYATKCPFTGKLILETESGKTITLILATDNCAVWHNGTTYYTYHRLIPEWGYTNNDELVDLFVAE